MIISFVLTHDVGDGVATFETVQTGLWEAFGLDQTATEVLQQTTVFFDGDPLTQKWSIGQFRYYY